MKALLAALLLLPTLAWSADGLVYGPCWDGRYYSGTDATACPPELTSPSGGADISATTSGASVSTSTDSGTLYMCYKATSSAGVCPTPPSYARMLAGSGDGFTCANNATPASGLNEFALSSLTPSTEYCTWYLQVDDRGYPHSHLADVGDYIVESAPWSTLASAPETGPGADLDTLNALFVDSVDGNDTGNDCTSAAAPCKTLATAWGKTHTAGQDIYLKAGSTFADGGTSRVVNWTGSAADPVVIGCYYRDSANANQATACDEGAGAGAQTIPIIEGSTKNCYLTYTCTYIGAIYTPKIHVIRDYVHVKHLGLHYLSGRGLMFEGDQDPDGSVVYGRAEGIDIYVAGDNGILLQDSARHIVVRDSTIDRAAECQRQRINGGDCKDASGNNFAYPAMLSVSRATGADVLIENNTIRNAWGEAIGTYESSFVIVRGNRTSDVRSASLYCGACSDVVFESNINLRNDEFASGQDYANGLWSVAVETGRNSSAYVGYAIDNVVFRNNIGIDRNHCLTTGKMDATTSPQWSMDVHAYGNTCVVPYTTLFSAVNGAAYSPRAINVKSNAFYNPGVTACSTIAGDTFNYNGWHTDPAGTACNGANDQISTTFNFAYTDRADWRAIDIEQIDPEYVRPGVGSALLANGDPSLETTTIIDATEFPILSEATYPYSPNATNWEKALYYDFYGNARSATVPNIGAIEGAVP